MCKYCKIREDDENDGVITIKEKGIKSDIYPTSVSLLMIANDKDGFCLSAEVCGYEHSILASKKIKYCPFCGRKL